ncbi:MAG: ABC transporter permease [Chloroflexi bacterium]|nr:ABC transporter permease [Chloroflexota bacterium]
MAVTTNQVRARAGGDAVWVVVRPLWAGFQFTRRWPVIPLFIIGVLLFTAIFAPWLEPYDPIDNQNAYLRPPAWTAEGTRAFIFGTDDVGRDILSRMIEASRITVVVVLIAVTTGMVSGTILGLLAGYFGGSLLDEAVMRIVDVWAALPQLLILLAIALVFGQGYVVLIASLALISWPGAVRLVRVEALKLRKMDYVDMARISGASNGRILYRHILPGVVNTVLVSATLSTGSLIMAEATLSFLGAGVPAPNPSLGGMIATGREWLRDAPHLASFPGLAVALIVMAGNFLGDWMRDRFDPRLRQVS